MNVLIVDDEPVSRERLTRMLGELDNCQILGSSGSTGEQTLKLINQLKPDVVFLDVTISGDMNGLQVAAKLKELDSPPAVIFCTDQDSYAYEAMQVNAAGYMVKPARSEALREVLHQAQRPNRIQLVNLNQSTAKEVSKTSVRHHISAKTRRGIELIPLKHAIFFRADHKYVSLRHEQGEVLLDESLKSLESEFSEQLVRIHRNTLVVKDRIESLKRDNQGHFNLYLRGLVNEGLNVSRRHLPGLRRIMEKL